MEQLFGAQWCISLSLVDAPTQMSVSCQFLSSAEMVLAEAVAGPGLMALSPGVEVLTPGGDPGARATSSPQGPGSRIFGSD